MRNRIPAFEGLRNERFKYVRYFDHGDHEFLHDLKNDPDELINLAGDPNHSGTLESMRERLPIGPVFSAWRTCLPRSGASVSKTWSFCPIRIRS